MNEVWGGWVVVGVSPGVPWPWWAPRGERERESWYLRLCVVVVMRWSNKATTCHKKFGCRFVLTKKSVELIRLQQIFTEFVFALSWLRRN